MNLTRNAILGLLVTCLFAAPAAAQAPCTGDLDADRVVDGDDLGMLLGAWGACGGCVADINADPKFVPSAEFFQSLEHSVAVLERVYPDRNEYLLSALRLAEVSKRGDYAEMKLVAKSISRSAPFL